MAAHGFDRLAAIYDFLARLVFGGAIDKAQQVHLAHLPPGATALVLGGGTGRFLPALLRINPDARVVFIDASSGMISRAARRVKGTGQVRFIHGTEEDIPAGDYDAVITPFYLDLFSDPELADVLARIGTHLKPGALWIVAEFGTERGWHRLMIRVMYLFFRYATGLTTRALPDWAGALGQAGWHRVAVRKFYGAFIEASLWQRRP